MKNILQFFIVIILFSSCNSSINFKHEIYFYSWKNKFFKNFNNYYYFNQPIKKVIIRYYNTEEKFGELTKAKEIKSYTTEFNKQGIVIFFAFNYPNGSHGGTVSNTIPDGNLTERISENRKIKYSYNDDNQRKSETYFYEEESQKKIIYTYNKEHLISEINHFASDGKLKFKLILEYNENNERKNITSYNPDGTFRSKISYKYNDNQMLIKRVGYSDERIIGEKESMVYQAFDERGNWTKCLETDEQFKVESNPSSFNRVSKYIIEREIIYFDNSDFEDNDDNSSHSDNKTLFDKIFN